MRLTARLFPLGLLLTAPLVAANIVVNPNPIVAANSITASVTGADMAGLIVTATFAEPQGPTVFQMTWAATGPASGSASSGGVVSVSLNGNASGSLAWNFGSGLLSPLLSLEFDGTAAGIYFDRAHSGPGTPGSGPGGDIVFGPPIFPPGIDASFTVTYSSAVALDGSPPDNDLYAKLRIDLPNIPPTTFTFTQDTDRNIVPEPASWLLVAGGFAVFVAGLRRRWLIAQTPRSN